MTGGRPRLLFIAHLVPYPLDAGARIRTWHLLEELARHFTIDGLFLNRRGASLPAGATPALARVCAPTIVGLSGGLSRRGWVAALRGLIAGRPYTDYLHASGEARDWLRNAVDSGAYTVCHVDSIDLRAYLPMLEPERVCLGHHNIESQVLQRRGNAADTLFRRRILLAQAELVRGAETAASQRVALNVCVSDLDAELLASRANGVRTTVVTNGVDTDYYTPKPGPPRPGGSLVFLGGMDWPPNLDAVRYFVERIHPLLPDGEESRLVCIGRIAGPRRDWAGVTWAGHLPDIRPMVRDAGAVVVPLRVGGGTRLKILTAWAMGKAVVSTTLGAEGLEASHGENILLADSPSDFASSLTRLRNDPGLAARLGEAGRATVERRYDWRIVGRTLREQYRRVASGMPPT